jgi:hypothetical protein
MIFKKHAANNKWLEYMRIPRIHIQHPSYQMISLRIQCRLSVSNLVVWKAHRMLLISIKVL